MINYYEILGLSYGATPDEIKASFRQLAKLYHPDKNPAGIEQFTKILKAYETLSDPALKASYDYKLNYHQAQTQQQQSKAANSKTWRFDEREMKRRQYYNDHIKKYAKQTSDYMAQAETKKNYNEFKYILFATPVAVILFLLIMHLATRDRGEVLETQKPEVSSEQSAVGSRQAVGSQQPQVSSQPTVASSDLKLGDAPYTALFGFPYYDTLHDKTLLVKNLSGMEVVVCLFSKKEFVRSFYMKENISAEVSRLPADALYIYYSSGRKFDSSRQLKESGVFGAFTEDLAFYKSIQPNKLGPVSELTLLKGENEGFRRIEEKEFFERSKR